jgi:hypothetical protein
MSVRVRVVAWEIQPVVVIDDGDSLTEIPIQRPVRIAAKDWQAFKDGGDEQAIERLRTQITSLEDG